ncbi:hypothetical protein ABPG74_019923 [Tetrahymena malaccensis]
MKGSKCPVLNQISILWNHILLQEGITLKNYLGLLLHYFLLAFIFVTAESLQPMLIQQEFNIEKKDQGSQNANLLLADIITKIIFAPIMGIVCDKFGRRVTLFYGICIVTLALCLMPLSNNIYPTYLLIRILYAHGAITISIIPLLADYVTNATKGKGAAVNVILASLGAVASVEIINNGLQNSMNVKGIYWLISSCYFVIGALMCYLIKSGVYYVDKEKSVVEKRGFIQMIKVGVRSAKNPWILIGYVTNFLARGDSILLTLFLVLWSNHYIEDYDEANIKAATLSGISYTVILVFSIFYGIFLEKTSKYLTHLIMFVLTMLGCFMMIGATSGPNNWYSYLTICILGSGMSGLYTSSQYLINKYSEANHRGYITGLASLVSVLGIFICAVIGGYLFDHWTIIAPFILFGIMSSIGIVILVIVWIFEKKQQSDGYVELQD